MAKTGRPIVNIFIERPRCNIEGCGNLTRTLLKRRDGTRNYDKVCQRHHFEKYGMHIGSWKLKLDNKVPCVICGWDKAHCDRHRVKTYKSKTRGYARENVIIVCPNCHRLIHAGLLKL